MAQPPAPSPQCYLFLDELQVLTDRYLKEGLAPLEIMIALAIATVKTAGADPTNKQSHIEYFSGAVLRFAKVTVVDDDGYPFYPDN